jgi:hypothetical protein
MGLFESIERAIGRFNRWFGGAPAAAQAESPAATTQIRAMAATDVAEDVEEATSAQPQPGSVETEEQPPHE